MSKYKRYIKDSYCYFSPNQTDPYIKNNLFATLGNGMIEKFRILIPEVIYALLKNVNV